MTNNCEVVVKLNSSCNLLNMLLDQQLIQAQVRVPRGPVYLLDQIDRRLQVHAEIDESPNNTLAFVLFLFEHKHVMVVVLLQLLVGKVDA